MRRTLLVAVALLALAPGAAHAATTVVVKGAGNGHGVGMSQYGAYGYAQTGSSYRSILAHFYRGTGITTQPSRHVRVLLQERKTAIRIRGANTASGGRTLNRDTIYKVKPRGDGLGLYRDDGTFVAQYGTLFSVWRPDGALRLFGTALNGLVDGVYRGSMRFIRDGAYVSAINLLPIDQYVQGVVPGEMPSSWHAEALKSQAVAARTYALATLKTGAPFDLYPDTRSQVYRGLTGEAASTNAAVQATALQTVTYNGSVIVTYFFSSSGGQTENVENYFIGSTPKPYLTSVDDPRDSISPYHSWRVTFTPAEMKAKLGGYVIGDYVRIDVLQRGVSPRIVRARVIGTQGTHDITGPTLRSRLGLRSTWATFTNVTS